MSLFGIAVIAPLALFAFGSFVLFPFVIYLQERKNFPRVEPLRVMAYGLGWIVIGLYDYFRLKLLAFFVSPEVLRFAAHQACCRNGRYNYLLWHKKPIVEGLENLPKPGKSAVIAANHQSMMDVAAFCFVEADYAWVSKDTVFLAPGVGWTMGLAKYVPIKRTNDASKKELFRLCKERLVQGVSIVMFPQGTRNRKEILPFKPGAFKMAAEGNVPIVPVSIIIPEDLWLNSCQTPAKIIFHPPITGSDVEKLKTDTFKAVTGSLTSKGN